MSQGADSTGVRAWEVENVLSPMALAEERLRIRVGSRLVAKSVASENRSRIDRHKTPSHGLVERFLARLESPPSM
jgi:hypothetical protein